MDRQRPLVRIRPGHPVLEKLRLNDHQPSSPGLFSARSWDATGRRKPEREGVGLAGAEYHGGGRVDVHPSHPTSALAAVDAVSVPEQIPRRRVPVARLTPKLGHSRADGTCGRHSVVFR